MEEHTQFIRFYQDFKQRYIPLFISWRIFCHTTRGQNHQFHLVVCLKFGACFQLSTFQLGKVWWTEVCPETFGPPKTKNQKNGPTFYDMVDVRVFLFRTRPKKLFIYIYI